MSAECSVHGVDLHGDTFSGLICPVCKSEEAIARLEAERDYLLHMPEGLSARNMILCAITGKRPDEGDWKDSYTPRDRGDLGRCERAYELAPDHLKSRMRSIIDGWAAALEAGSL